MINKKPKQTVTIDRAKWRTGRNGPNKTGTGITNLLNGEGCLCCLGFTIIQTSPDTPPEALLGNKSPRDLEMELPGLVYTLADDWISNTVLARRAISINDDPDTTPQQKEAKLLKLCEDDDWPYQFEFVGEYPVKGAAKS